MDQVGTPRGDYRRRTRSAAPALGVLVAALLLGACRDGTGDERAEAWAPGSDIAPFVLGGARVNVTSGGADLVALDPLSFEPSAHRPSLAARAPDGSWSTLPEPPSRYVSAALGSANDRVVLVGAVCEDTCSDGGRLEVALLDRDRRSWSVADTDLEFTDAEPGISSLQARGAVALFGTPAGRIQVDDTGAVEAVSTQPDLRPGSSASCLVGNQLVSANSVATSGDGSGTSAPMTFELHTVGVLDLDGAEGWETAERPAFTVAGAGSAACTAAGMLFLDSGVESTFDVASGRWEQRTIDHTGWTGALAPSPIGVSAVAPDRSVYAIDSLGSVVHRTLDGTWTDTGIDAMHLVATAEQVLGIRMLESTVVEITAG